MPPQFGVTEPAQAGFHTGLPSAVTPAHEYSGIDPFTAPVGNGLYGMDNADNHSMPPMMMPNGNSFQIMNSMLPLQSNNNFSFNGHPGYGGDTSNGGISGIGNIGAGHAYNNHITPSNVRGTIMESKETTDNKSDRTLDHDSDSSGNIHLANATAHSNIKNPNLHLNTSINHYHNDVDFAPSPADLLDGESGVTPAMAQTGFDNFNNFDPHNFQPHSLTKNLSLDSGYYSDAHNNNEIYDTTEHEPLELMLNDDLFDQEYGHY